MQIERHVKGMHIDGNKMECLLRRRRQIKDRHRLLVVGILGSAFLHDIQAAARAAAGYISRFKVKDISSAGKD